MPLSPDALPLSSRLSPRLEAVARAGSTNSDLVAAVGAAPEGWPHLSVLVTDDQTAGRGRLDRVWRAGPGQMLAVSVLLRTDGLPGPALGWIPLLAGAAMVEAIDAALPPEGPRARLKWPNDVLVDGRKICGILAEAVPALPGVVVGAGVNTAMPAEALPVPTAVSLAALGARTAPDPLLAAYLTGLRRRMEAFRAAGGDASAAGLHEEVSRVCRTLGTRVRVELPDGAVLGGTARGLDVDGALQVEDDEGGGNRRVVSGDIVHLR